MKIITGSTGTAHVTSNDAGELHQAIFGTGNIVPNIGECLEATLVSNNTITIADGDLIMQGRHALIEPGLTETVTIDTGSVGYNRNDLIVARYELDEDTGYESITLEVLKGTETTGTAQDPTYANGDIRTGALVADFPLYRVSISGVTITAVTPLFNVFNKTLGYAPTKSDLGLGNVDNTHDANKNVNSAKFANETQQAILGTAGLRNVVFTTTEPVEGEASTLPIGTIIAVYE